MAGWAYRYLAAKTPFFLHAFHLPDLQQRRGNLQSWCRQTITRFNILLPNGQPDLNRYAGGSLPSPTAY